MIEVNYYYHTRDNKWKYGSNTFYDLEKACRFIYSVIRSKNKVFDGFTCDDEETRIYINRRCNL